MTTMTASTRFAYAANALYPKLTRNAGAVLAALPHDGELEDFPGRKYCTVVTFRADGTPVATPVWFGLTLGALVFRSLADTAKVRRLRANSRVLVAPSTMRGTPLGNPLQGEARVLEGEAAAEAEQAIRRNYGGIRAGYKKAISDAPAVYVEITPA